MADRVVESMNDDEWEEGMVVGSASAENAPSAEDVRLRAQLREAAAVLVQQGQPDLARLAALLVQLRFRDAMWALDDGARDVNFAGEGDPVLFDGFRRSISGHVLNLQEAGYDVEEISDLVFPHLVLRAAQQAAGLIPRDVVVFGGGGESQPYRNGGFGAVPASAAAVHSLEKETFRAGAGACLECSICVEEFVDGEQVSVMPCPSRGHKFHPDCIAKWLGISNMCPLCRHQLPVVY